MKNKAYTLLELIAVVAIVAVLATLGQAQYKKAMEKSRSAEAKSILGNLRSAELAYNLKWGNWASSAVLNAGAPSDCVSTNYFFYSCNDLSGTCNAVRCTDPNGKPPPGPSAYSITLDTSGSWSGTAGWY